MMYKILEHFEDALIAKQQKKRILYVEKLKQQIKKAVDFQEKQSVVRQEIDKDIAYFIPSTSQGAQKNDRGAEFRAI